MDTKELRVDGLARIKGTHSEPSKWGYEGQTVIITELSRLTARFIILSPRKDQIHYHTEGGNHLYGRWGLHPDNLEPL